MFWRRNRPRNVILMYHRVARLKPDPWSLCVTPEHFAEHLQVLQKYTRVRLDKFDPGSKSPTVAITFDDGYADNLYEAVPLLARFDTPATFFITTGYIGGGREFWWDELERIVFQSPRPGPSPDALYQQLYAELRPMDHEVRRRRLDTLAQELNAAGRPRSSHRILTSRELANLARHPLFEIGAHTVTHPLLAAQPAEIQYAELSESKKNLEVWLNREVTSFSYPYGGREHYSDVTVEAARRCGFGRACTTESGPVTAADSPHEWGRLNIVDMDGDQFHKVLFN